MKNQLGVKQGEWLTLFCFYNSFNGIAMPPILMVGGPLIPQKSK